MSHLIEVGRRHTIERLARIEVRCPPCDEVRKLAVYVERRVGTIMLLPIGPRQTSYHVQCPMCFSTWDISKSDAVWLADPESDLTGYKPHNTVLTDPGGRH